LKARVHEGYLPFPAFQLEYFANIKLISLDHRKNVMKTASLSAMLPTAMEAEIWEPALLRRDLRKLKGRSAGRGLPAVLVLMLLALLTACSSDADKPAEPAKPEVKGPELLTARSAFQKLYVAARGWSQDAKPYRLWAVWRCSFASATQRSAKAYTWSGSAADGAPPRGVNPGHEDSYSPSNSSTQVYDMAFLKIDSDQAFATAQKHGGDKVLEKAPDTPVIYVCDWNHNTNELTCHLWREP
jgi:hypothetical protein